MIKSEIIQVLLCEAVNLATGNQSKYEYNVLMAAVFEMYNKQYVEWRQQQPKDTAHAVHADVAGKISAVSGGILPVLRRNNLEKAGSKCAPLVQIPGVFTEQSDAVHFQNSMPRHTQGVMLAEVEVAREDGETLRSELYSSPCISSGSPCAHKGSAGRTRRVHKANVFSALEFEEYKPIGVYTDRMLKISPILAGEIRKAGIEQVKTNIMKMLQNVTGFFCAVPDMVEIDDDSVAQLQAQMHFLLPRISLQTLQENVRAYQIYNTGIHLLTDEAEPVVFPNERCHNVIRLPREVVSVCTTMSYALSENIPKTDCRFQLISALRTEIVTNLLHSLF